VGCKGGAEIAVEIRAERSSPRIESGTNSRKCRQLGGVCQALSCLSLFLAGAVATFCGTMERGCASDRMDKNIYKL